MDGHGAVKLRALMGKTEIDGDTMQAPAMTPQKSHREEHDYLDNLDTLRAVALGAFGDINHRFELYLNSASRPG